MTIVIDQSAFSDLCAANGRLRTENGINANGRRTTQSVSKTRALSAEEKAGLAIEAAIKLLAGLKHPAVTVTREPLATVAKQKKSA